MALNAKQKQQVRDQFMQGFAESRDKLGDDVLRTATNQITIPFEFEGEEGYMRVTFQIPTGSRDGTPYDGYFEAEHFEEEQERKRIAAEEKKQQKKKKIERDNKYRDVIKENKRKEREGG